MQDDTHEFMVEAARQAGAQLDREEQTPARPRLRDLPAEERAAFASYMREHRKSYPVIPGLPESEQDAYFPWVLDEFRRSRSRSDPRST